MMSSGCSINAAWGNIHRYYGDPPESEDFMSEVTFANALWCFLYYIHPDYYNKWGVCPHCRDKWMSVVVDGQSLGPASNKVFKDNLREIATDEGVPTRECIPMKNRLFVPHKKVRDPLIRLLGTSVADHMSYKSLVDALSKEPSLEGLVRLVITVSYPCIAREESHDHARDGDCYVCHLSNKDAQCHLPNKSQSRSTVRKIKDLLQGTADAPAIIIPNGHRDTLLKLCQGTTVDGTISYTICEYEAVSEALEALLPISPDMTSGIKQQLVMVYPCKTSEEGREGHATQCYKCHLKDDSAVCYVSSSTNKKILSLLSDLLKSTSVYGGMVKTPEDTVKYIESFLQYGSDHPGKCMCSFGVQLFVRS